MGFETPLALIALVAAALPIVAHLLRRQDLPTIPLPTVVLLQRAEAQNQKRVRLVDLLLLALRILMLALLAVAIAGPFLRVTLSYGDGTLASLAIVVDDSMSAVGRGGRDAARERIEEVIDSLPPGSEVAVILGGRPARVLAGRTDDLSSAVRALDRMERGDAHGTDIEAAMELADQELAGARHANRRVLLLTDGAAHAALEELSPDRSVAFEVEVIGAASTQRNAALVDARATPDPSAPDMLSVAVVLRASPELDGERVDVTVRGDDGESILARGEVEIANGGAHTTLRLPRPEGGPRGEVVIEVDDAIEADDHRGVLLRDQSATQVVVVDGDPHPVRGADEARFVARALDLAPTAEGAGGPIARRTVDPDTFETLDLARVDVVILANAPTPSEARAERLRAFVARGGGLLIAPGDHFDGRAMSAALGDLLPGAPRVASQADVGGPRATPETSWLERPDGLERASTRQRLTFDELPMGAEVALRFADESPALVIAPYQQGRVAVLATTLDDDWTNLPLQPGFLPLMVETSRRLAPGSRMPDAAFAPGVPVTMRAPAGASRVLVSTPDRRVIELESRDGPIEIDETDAPGVYVVEIGTDERAPEIAPELAFLVAPPPEESDLLPGRLPTAVEQGEDGESDATEVTVNRPIGRWLFLAVGLLALAEGLVRLRRRRNLRRRTAAA